MLKLIFYQLLYVMSYNFHFCTLFALGMIQQLRNAVVAPTALVWEKIMVGLCLC